MASSTTSLKLDPGMKARVQQLAEARRRTPHWIMREAVAEYVEREEKRERFRQDTLDSWNEYAETGLHLTSEEVFDWMRKIASGEKAELPECHL